mgnify:CR=1 FL=1
MRLNASDGHKLRGYFGNLFRERSPLLHNHFEEGGLRYAYPLVQYKVIRRTPMLVGLEEGAKLLVELFTQIKELDIGGEIHPVEEKQIEFQTCPVGVGEDLYEYRFQTLWMGLNQNNYSRYQELSEAERPGLLNKILVGNILTLFKGIQHRTEKRILVKTKLHEKQTQFKGQRMLAFRGSFTTNAKLPAYIGLGKSPARGFGTITHPNP